jgi:electron transport complex protein RnfD
MSETASPTEVAKPKAPEQFLVGSAPHLAGSRTTQGVMFDVVLGLMPLMVAAILLYRGRAVLLTLATTAGCLITEALANRMRGRGLNSLLDGSAIVTGVILAFSLPPMLPIYMAFIGGVVAVGLGKAIFGGLGHNLFNPAMVGRAFLMICFPVAMTMWAEPGTLATIGGVDAVTQATPLAAAKFHNDVLPGLWPLFVGKVGGCIGETSALACLIGGAYLLVRRTADWRQPVAMLVSAMVFAVIAHRFAPEKCASPLYHLNSGALLFGALFIATDYVGAPITPLGRWIFGAGAGALVMLIRVFGGYPEGLMYAILIMNALTPLIERWTVPTPFGGHVTDA